MSADIIAWLRSDEGEKWSRDHHNRPSGVPNSPVIIATTGVVDLTQDPCGGPPLEAA
jgi:hypothetical protein